jgi:hypothetical protein
VAAPGREECCYRLRSVKLEVSPAGPVDAPCCAGFQFFHHLVYVPPSYHLSVTGQATSDRNDRNRKNDIPNSGKEAVLQKGGDAGRRGVGMGAVYGGGGIVYDDKEVDRYVATSDYVAWLG